MKYLSNILFLLVLFGCEKELKLNPSSFSKKLVVNAFIAKDSAIKVGLSSSVSTLGSPSYISLKGNADVILRRNGILLYNDVTSIIEGEFTLPYAAKSNSNYEIEVSYLDYPTIKAVDVVPAEDVVVSIDTIIEQSSSYRLKFTLEDPIDANKYLLQLKSFGRLLEDLDSIDSTEPVNFTSSDKLFLTNIRTVAADNSYTIFDDALINGQAKTVELLISKQQFIQQGFTPKNINLKLSCISETMYSYYKSILENTHIYGGPLASVTSQESNIEQGLGVFCFYTTAFKEIKLP